MSDDYNIRAAKGQAFNLAVHEAVAAGKGKDTKYIYENFIYYYELGQLVQSANLEELREALK